MLDGTKECRYLAHSRFMERKKEQPLIGIEWLAVALAVALLSIVGATPFTVSAAFIERFDEFGALEELSWLSRAVLTPTFGLLNVITISICLAVFVVLRSRVTARRLVIAFAVLWGVIALALYIYGVYSPLFNVAEEMGP